ncbi:MAG: class I SAM-dependent methyltransferase [Acidimicrobiia bacterium]
MVSVHRFHQISEVDHRILNPLSLEQLLLLGDICKLQPAQRHLDLASGKGEMLCQYAHRHGTTGLGIDVFPPYTSMANARAVELGVDHLVHFIEGDAALHEAEPGSFDVVSCIGATWIGGGLSGTLELMRAPLHATGWLLVGEAYWNDQPPDAAKAALHLGDEFTDLSGNLGRFEDAGLDLVEMVLATPETWDRYATSQWLNVSTWLDEHADDPDADDVRAIRDDARRSYLRYGRRYLGWGVFVLRPMRRAASLDM